MGRLAWRALLLFTALTLLALVIGWGAGLLIRPGEGIALPSAEAAGDVPTRALTFTGVLEQAVPQSIIDAAARNDVLQVLVFSLLFGVALAKVNADRRAPVLRVLEGVAETMFRFTGFVMAYAPIGIGAAIAVTVAQSGLGVLRHLGVLILTVYAALAVFILCILLPLALLARVPLREFLKVAREPSLLAFSAASSDAALPQAMRALEGYGVPRRIVSFVMPTALSFNLTGSTLFVGLATLFVAQAAGMALSLGQQLAMMGTLMLTTKGIAAVPRASLVILSATLTTFGLPLEGVALILAVDALMDMARTGTNMLSHCLATVVLARWEKPAMTS
jgi:proton glutamate symport protein